jgi:hypothetical protein
MVSVNRGSQQCGARPIGCGRRSERQHGPRVRKPVTPRNDRIFFSLRGAQHVKRSAIRDWIAGAVMLLAAASWGLVAALLAS